MSAASPPEGAPVFPAVGRWLVTAIPQGWTYVLQFGIRQIVPAANAVPANVGLGEDQLAAEDGLKDYVAAQVKMIQSHLENPVLAGPQPTTFPGAEEACLLFVRHTAANGVLMLHAQTYVRSGLWLGIVTLTTPEQALQSIRPAYDAFVKGLYVSASTAATQ